MDMELFANLLPAFAVGLVQALPRIIIHAMFAAGIYRDADAMRREDSAHFSSARRCGHLPVLPAASSSGTCFTVF
jgi:hypothetical protein